MANLYEKYKDDPEMLVAIAEREREISQCWRIFSL